MIRGGSGRNRLLAGALLLGVLSSCGEGSSQNPAPPTLVVVTIDGLELPDGSPGSRIPESMPQLSAWADSGTVFDPCVVASESTQATLASLWTGLDPHRHGVVSVHLPGRRRLRESAETLAERLQVEGWETRSAVSLPQLAAKISGLDQGFGHHLAPTPRVPKGAWSSAELLERCRPEFAEALSGERPALLWVHLADARSRPADDDPDFIAALEVELEAYRDDENVSRWFARSGPEEREATETLRRSIGRYREGGARHALERAEAKARRVQIDRALGTLATWVEGHGRGEAARWLVVGTRGARRSEGVEALWESSSRAVERSLVTCVWRDATGSSVGSSLGANSGAEGMDLLRTVDLFPSLLEALELPVPAGLDGLPWQSEGVRRARVRGAARGGVLAVASERAQARVAWGLGEFEGSGGTVGLGKDEGAVGTLAPHEAGVADRELSLWADSPNELQTLECAWIAPAEPSSVPVDLRARRPLWIRSRGEVTRLQRQVSELEASAATERIAWSGEATDLRLTFGSREHPMDSSRLLVGRRLRAHGLPFVFFENGEAWPEAEEGASTIEPRVDVGQGPGRRLRVEVFAEAGSEVEVGLLGWSDGLVDEDLVVEVEGDARVEAFDGRPDGRCVRGTGPVSFLFERNPKVQPAMWVRIDGEPLPPTDFRYRGRRIFPSGRTSILIPARLPALTEPLRAGETPPEEGSLPSGAPDDAVVLRWWGRTPLAPTRDTLSEDERRFLARLPEDE